MVSPKTKMLPFLIAISAATRALSLQQRPKYQRRRDFFKIAGATLISGTVPKNRRADAACLPGDLSPECIGVYKIPFEDARNARTLNSPEALKKNAPDVNYVKPMTMPKNVLQAKEILETQRAAADDIQNVVMAGKLEEAGIKVLNLIPKVTAAGQIIQEQVQEKYPMDASGANQMRVMKFNQQRQELITAWSQIDVEIGQALRGQTGITLAQIDLLNSIKEGISIFDEFLVAVESSTK